MNQTLTRTGPNITLRVITRDEGNDYEFPLEITEKDVNFAEKLGVIERYKKRFKLDFVSMELLLSLAAFTKVKEKFHEIKDSLISIDDEGCITEFYCKKGDKITYQIFCNDDFFATNSMIIT